MEEFADCIGKEMIGIVKRGLMECVGSVFLGGVIVLIGGVFCGFVLGKIKITERKAGSDVDNKAGGEVES